MMEEKKNKKKHYLVGTLAIGMIFGAGTAGWQAKDLFFARFMQKNQRSIPAVAPSEEWITVFVHGTFSCLLGMFSLPAVLSDTVGNTLYKALAGSQRKNSEHYLDQAMLQRGLVKVKPTYDLHATNGQRFSAYPLAQAFQDFLRYTKKINHVNSFYTFGWSGLLSQKQRRIESVRFYNELTKELEHFHKAGKYPKIRLVAHSHGGNICLNLAAINDVLSLPSYKDVANSTTDAATNQALATMFDYLKTLPNKEQAAHAKRLKHLDHVPTMRITIDELVLLGTPVQIETEPFFFSPTFKKIYHFYSSKDSIQSLDCISTKKISLRKINYTTAGLPKIRAFPALVQSKIIVNRSKVRHNKKRSCGYAVTHRDLWSISWHKNRNPLAPLPIFVLTPLLIEALESQPSFCHDTDINIGVTSNHLKIQTTLPSDKKINATISIPRQDFDKIKKNLKRWDPYHKVKA